MAVVKEVEGYSNGFGFDEFKKGETVYVFHSNNMTDNAVLTEGTVVKLLRAENAKDQDVIRQVTIDIGKMNVVVTMPRYIKERIYKKDKVEVPVVEPKKAEQPSIIRESGLESMWIERAMGPKNKLVKQYVSEGWVFKEKKWDSEKNMYLSLVERSYQ